MLTAAERRALKGKAHKLQSVVPTGAKGLTDEVVAEIERALTAHGKTFLIYRKNP